ncbi:hypothetical protein DPX16_7777 [Anabarilius grahami]|uniref:Uncharacterized protein n=1 Tax=Anabarilius grahami TaxID=495550 RepID=A0A3N0XJG7_ANAGA|nr:hypothetical protein DPX16_7777 [Anabarilius grahami]
MTIINDNWRFTRSQKAKDLDCGVTTDIEIYRLIPVTRLFGEQPVWGPQRRPEFVRSPLLSPALGSLPLD